MTWNAQAGQIILEGAEAEMFRDTILYVCDIVTGAENDNESFFEGAQIFDRMTRAQQLACLETVSRYLFHKTEECLDLTAWSEATLASVLHEIRTFVFLEIEEGERDDYRQVIVDSLEAAAELQDIDDPKEWAWMLDAYEARFLWDTDYEDDDITDLAPEHAKTVRQLMSIPEDYYSTIPPDLDVESNIERGAKQVWMAIDGTKTIRMTATLTCEVPASLAIETVDEGLVTLRRIFPQVILMQVEQRGEIVEAPDELHEFFFNGGTVDYSIEHVTSVTKRK